MFRDVVEPEKLLMMSGTNKNTCSSWKWKLHVRCDSDTPCAQFRPVHRVRARLGARSKQLVVVLATSCLMVGHSQSVFSVAHARAKRRPQPLWWHRRQLRWQWRCMLLQVLKILKTYFTINCHSRRHIARLTPPPPRHPLATCPLSRSVRGCHYIFLAFLKLVRHGKNNALLLNLS